MPPDKRKIVLVTGAAGYIGRHVLRAFSDNFLIIAVIRDGSSQLEEAYATLIGDIGDRAFVRSVFLEYKIDVVVHLAGSTLATESVSEPLKYYRNNFSNTIVLVEEMLAHSVNCLVFASTAAVYGIPSSSEFRGTPLTPDFPPNPVSPYAYSKLFAERAIADAVSAHGSQLSAVCLRLFNASGAHPKADIGHESGSLISLLLQCALGQRPFVNIFSGYSGTADGTCIRDYVHVMDIARAVAMAVEWLLRQREENSNTSRLVRLNVGSGSKHTVKELISVIERVTGRDLPVRYMPPREGDPPILIGSIIDTKKLLGWEPEMSLEEIISSAYKYQQKQLLEKEKK